MTSPLVNHDSCKSSLYIIESIEEFKGVQTFMASSSSASCALPAFALSTKPPYIAANRPSSLASSGSTLLSSRRIICPGCQGRGSSFAGTFGLAEPPLLGGFVAVATPANRLYHCDCAIAERLKVRIRKMVVSVSGKRSPRRRRASERKFNGCPIWWKLLIAH